MDDKNIGVPYVVYESEMARQERRNKRLVFVLLVLIAAIVLTNLAWLYAWMQYDYVSYEAVATDTGDANIVGRDGNIYGDSQNENTNTEEQDSQGSENP